MLGFSLSDLFWHRYSLEVSCHDLLEYVAFWIDLVGIWSGRVMLRFVGIMRSIMMGSDGLCWDLVMQIYVGIMSGRTVCWDFDGSCLELVERRVVLGSVGIMMGYVGIYLGKSTLG